MTDTTNPALTLDHNAQVPVSLTPGSNGKVEVVVDCQRLSSRYLLGEGGHFRTSPGMSLRGATQDLHPTITYDAANKKLHLSANVGDIDRLTLSVYGQPIIDWQKSNAGSWQPDAATQHHRLIASELRMLGTSEVPLPGVPADRALWQGFDPKIHAPVTDLHTHSSAQITAQEFMDLGLAHQIDYPVELLETLGITLTDEERAAVEKDGGQGLTFEPTKKEGLKCEQGGGTTYDVIALASLSKPHRDLIMSKLHVPQDGVLCFSDFDREMYRYLNPFSKNPQLAKDIIYKIGESYAAQGVRYAELSTSAMLQADKNGQAKWFREMVGAVDQVEKDLGVRLRFLVGIPRDKAPHEVLAMIEKLKYAARHPYIAGVDILGYEKNKAKQLSWALEHVADWARTSHGTDLDPHHGWDFLRDLVVRTHAGETAKNDGNVMESVRIAERTGVRVRIAHAVHEREDAQLDASIKRLSQGEGSPRLGFEFCPESNLAYNNITQLSQVPYARWTQLCPHWFLGSDGSGSVQTTPTQLALAALSGGLKLDRLAHLRQNEESYIAEERERHTLKTAAFEKHYGKNANAAFFMGFEKHLERVDQLTNPKLLDPIHPRLPEEFNEKIPILIAGAGGESWERMDKDPQRAATDSLRLLVAGLDPTKVFFVCGRTKSEGVTKALDEALQLHNEANPTNRFSLLALNTAETADIARSISWIVPQGNDTSKVAASTTAFMRDYQPPGLSVFMGGSNFTQDMIAQTMRNERAKYLLMENATGASADGAKKVKDARKFNDPSTLLQRVAESLQRLHPQQGIFRDGVNPFDTASLERLAAQMKRDHTPQTGIVAGSAYTIAPAHPVVVETALPKSV